VTTYLLLHGGAGPASMRPLADLLTARGGRVIVPVHPGFAGTARPRGLTSIRALAHHYADTLDLRDVTVIGNSIGGWVAAELALLSERGPAGVVLVNAG
jgi:pimeloyl-ACP methyl ester carboxylesterase